MNPDSPAPAHTFSRRVGQGAEILAPVLRFFTTSGYARRRKLPDVCDFAVGNPHEPVLEELTSALQRAAVPRSADWFAYPESLPDAQHAAAAALSQRLGVEFEPADVLLTTGAFGALAVTLYALVDPGDEVIFLSPPWFFYAALIAAYDGVPVRVAVDPATWLPDAEAIARAITPRTRAVIVNSPNNPTGKIYGHDLLAAVAAVLTAASERYGRQITLISDESYSRIVFDGAEFVSPSRHYADTVVIYTFGKTLLAPGQRLGYIGLPTAMPQRAKVREALFMGQILLGYSFPTALMQHAVPALEELSVDIAPLQRRRDSMVAALTDIGYAVSPCQGTFYLMVRSPVADDEAFVEDLAKRNVFCLPGSVVEMPGYFRISLTATDAMVDRSLPVFAEALALAMAEAAKHSA